MRVQYRCSGAAEGAGGAEGGAGAGSVDLAAVGRAMFLSLSFAALFCGNGDRCRAQSALPLQFLQTALKTDPRRAVILLQGLLPVLELILLLRAQDTGALDRQVGDLLIVHRRLNSGRRRQNLPGVGDSWTRDRRSQRGRGRLHRRAAARALVTGGATRGGAVRTAEVRGGLRRSA